MNTTDVTQVEISKLKCAWLAGIIDGEGSIGLKRSKDDRIGRTALTYSPLFQITNCDFTLLDEVKSILKTLGVRFSYWKNTESKRNTNWQDSGNISVCACKDTIKLLNEVSPFLVSKRTHAELLLEFCDLRLKDRHRKVRYTIEKELWEKLHSLNRKGRR